MNLKLLIKKTILQILQIPLPISLDKKFKIKNNLILFDKIFQELDFIYVNINFDDQSPISGEIKNRDYGGNLKNGLTGKLQSFLEKYPSVGITSFVIPNFLGNKKKIENKFLITNPEYKDWVEKYHFLANNYNIEFALHGLYHYQRENPFFQRHTVFAFKNEKQISESIINGKQIFSSLGWVANGFRPPGWDLASDIDIFKVAKSTGLKYIACNSIDGGLNSGNPRINNYYPSLSDDIFSFPQNIELDWNIEKIILEIESLIKQKALISIKGHFVDKDICNCLNDENLQKLYIICSYFNKNYPKKMRFVTFNKLTQELTLMLKNLNTKTQ